MQIRPTYSRVKVPYDSCETLFYNESMSDMRDFRFLRRRVLMLLMGSSSVSDGQGGRTSVGSISLAPRACIFDMRFWFKVGIGGAVSGEGPLVESLCRDLGRRIVDARRSFWGLMKLELPSSGAVCGVRGVYGVDGVAGILPLTRVSYVFLEGPIAILASASFIEMERSRLCGGCLMMGDAEWVLEFS